MKSDVTAFVAGVTVGLTAGVGIGLGWIHPQNLNLGTLGEWVGGIGAMLAAGMAAYAAMQAEAMASRQLRIAEERANDRARAMLMAAKPNLLEVADALEKIGAARHLEPSELVLSAFMYHAGRLHPFVDEVNEPLVYDLPQEARHVVLDALGELKLLSRRALELHIDMGQLKSSITLEGVYFGSEPRVALANFYDFADASLLVEQLVARILRVIGARGSSE